MMIPVASRELERGISRVSILIITSFLIYCRSIRHEDKIRVLVGLPSVTMIFLLFISSFHDHPDVSVVSGFNIVLSRHSSVSIAFTRLKDEKRVAIGLR